MIQQETQKQRGMDSATKEAVYPMASGAVILTWPERIDPDEAEDLDDWLDMMKRKLKRSVANEGEESDG